MGVYYWSLMMYVRNQFMGVTLLFSCIQVILVVASLPQIAQIASTA